PSIALSFAGGDLRTDPTLIDRLVPTIREVLEHLTSMSSFPENTLFNVNFPPLAAHEIRGMRLTRLGRRVYSQSLTRMSDPWGREIFWIGGGFASWTGEADADFRAVEEGYVSITPLHLDLTNRDVLAAAADWWQDK